MDFAGNRYYDVHRILLTSIGLWPYQDPRTKKFQRVVSTVILASSVIVQLMKLVTSEYSLNLLLKVLSLTAPCAVAVLKYVSFCIGTETVKDLMENVMSDWHTLRTEVELEIMKKHSSLGRFYTMFFTLIVYFSFLVYLLIQFALDFFDILTPRNESQFHRIPIIAEYFVDQQKYYLPILLHIYVVAFVGFTTVMSTESLFMTYIQHAIGMFEVTSYRIEHAFDETLSTSASRKNCSHCAEIISAVSSHRRAIKFTKFLMSSFVVSYFFLLFLGVASLSVNLLRLFLATRLLDDLEELILSALFVLGHICYMFLGNYIGQKLIDHNMNIFHRTYESRWYVTPLHAQKLLLFMMRRSMKSSVISLGGVFVPSLEGFATITSMSLSYFTVIRSVQ